LKALFICAPVNPRDAANVVCLYPAPGTVADFKSAHQSGGACIVVPPESADFFQPGARYVFSIERETP
jgi:hypothetical protein